MQSTAKLDLNDKVVRKLLESSKKVRILNVLEYVMPLNR